MDVLSASLSAVHAAERRMAVSAHNVANWNTPSFRSFRVDLSSDPAGGVVSTARQASEPGRVDLASEFVEQTLARTQHAASLRVIGVASEMQGSLVDMFA